MNNSVGLPEEKQLTDRAIPGIPDVLVVEVGATVKNLSDQELAVLITAGSLTRLHSKLQGYEKYKHLAESDGTVRDDVLECVTYWAMSRRLSERR